MWCILTKSIGSCSVILIIIQNIVSVIYDAHNHLSLVCKYCSVPHSICTKFLLWWGSITSSCGLVRCDSHVLNDLPVDIKNIMPTFCSFWTVNPLRAKFFIGSIKSISTVYVIPPHWHDTGIWNLSSCKAGICLFYLVNIMVADDLVSSVTKASAGMWLTMLN